MMVKKKPRTKPKTATAGGNNGRKYPNGGMLKKCG
jgi:hypothetical protein